jgi:hypothetical protein
VHDVFVAHVVLEGASIVPIVGELRSNTLHKTYAPVDIAAVLNADAARLKGRRKMRAVNERGAKVSKIQPTRVSNGKPGNE